MKLEDIKQQEQYKQFEKTFNDCKQFLQSKNCGYDDLTATKLIVKLNNNSFGKDTIEIGKMYLKAINCELYMYKEIIYHLSEENPKDEETIKQLEYYNTRKSILENFYKSISYNISNCEQKLGILDKIKNDYAKPENDIRYTTDIKTEIELDNTNAGLNYAELIDDADTSDLKNWYKFLMDLHINPSREFVINKNNLCNLKLVFRNPITGLMTDKENVVHLSHSTSSKKMPVFSIGFRTYKAVSTGVKLLAGSLVTAALENVPLPFLHAISYMDHSSVEDLPPLDLYLIPIEQINDDGRFEVLMIKGIQFVDMNQNDNASSTGIYYSFSYFAEDIVPLDFSSLDNYIGTIKRQSLIKEEKENTI